MNSNRQGAIAEEVLGWKPEGFFRVTSGDVRGDILTILAIYRESAIITYEDQDLG